MKKHSFLLRNVTKRDINLGDLRFKIPAMGVKNLLSPKSHITVEDLANSISSGSLSKYLGKSLIHIKNLSRVSPKYKTESKVTTKGLKRLKTSVKEKAEDLSKELEEMTLMDDEEYLRELSMVDDISKGSAPLVRKQNEKKTKD